MNTRLMLLVAILLAPADGSAQSLADLAEKASRPREGGNQPKVITNADLKKEAAAPAETSDEVGRPAAAPAAPMTESSREAIIRSAAPAVVTIETSTATGSGFFVAPGLVVTNRHVIERASSLQIRFLNGRTSPGYVASTAVDADLALVRVDMPPSPQPTLAFASTRDVRVGEDVLAIGSPLGVLRSTVTRGIVSAVRTIDGLTYVQTDAAINPGNSGGPLIDGNGAVVGINTFRFAAQSLGFAIAADHAKTLVGGNSSVARRGADGGSDAGSKLDGAIAPAAKSEADVLREQGIEQFDKGVQSLKTAADQIDAAWGRYRNACGGTLANGSPNGRPWFGVWDPSLTIKDGDPQCRGYLNDIIGVASRVNAAMQALSEDARRAGVYPGTRREIRRKYSMDWSGWDR